MWDTRNSEHTKNLSITDSSSGYQRELTFRPLFQIEHSQTSNLAAIP